MRRERHPLAGLRLQQRQPDLRRNVEHDVERMFDADRNGIGLQQSQKGQKPAVDVAGAGHILRGKGVMQGAKIPRHDIGRDQRAPRPPARQ